MTPPRRRPSAKRSSVISIPAGLLANPRGALPRLDTALCGAAFSLDNSCAAPLFGKCRNAPRFWIAGELRPRRGAAKRSRMDAPRHPSFISRPVSARYKALVDGGTLERDPGQLAAVATLDRLVAALEQSRLARKSSALGWLFGQREPAQSPRGVY